MFVKCCLGKGWEKLMHGKIDSNHTRRHEHDDTDTDELDTEEEDSVKTLDMNIVYEEDDTAGGDCGDGGDM